MTTILPISDLRNYTEVLNQVDTDNPVFLTRNGRGTYVISKIEEYDRETTLAELKAALQHAEEMSKNKPPIPLEEVAKRFGVTL